MTGRPSLKTPEVVEEIIRRLSLGEPLSRICADDHMPCFMTVYRWERDDAEFSDLSARAREVGTHYLANECLEIADDARNDYMEKVDKDGAVIGYIVNGEATARSRLRIDTRLRLIGKWNSKAYGEKVEANVNHRGAIALSASELPEPLKFLAGDSEGAGEGSETAAGGVG